MWGSGAAGRLALETDNAGGEKGERREGEGGEGGGEEGERREGEGGGVGGEGGGEEGGGGGGEGRGGGGGGGLSWRPPDGALLVDVSCGMHMTMVVDDRGRIWSFGDNKVTPLT